MFAVEDLGVQDDQIPSDAKPSALGLAAVVVGPTLVNPGEVAGELDVTPSMLDRLAKQFLEEEIAPCGRIGQAARLWERRWRVAVLCVTSRVRHRHRGWIPGW